MYQSGEFVSNHVRQQDGSKVPEEQVQPHGVELTIDKVYSLQNYCVIGDDDYWKADRKEATSVESGEYALSSRGEDHTSLGITEAEEYDKIGKTESDVSVVEFDKPHYVLLAGPYVVVYNEVISVPPDNVGFVFPRSRLIRNNAFLSTAVWDSGYEGRGEGGLHINTMTFLEKSMRIGQFILCRAEVLEQYNGQHQGEKTD